MLEYEDLEFDDFIRLRFIIENKEIHISYPNFTRKPAVINQSTYYNNIAIRFPQEDGENDLVLMGDIFEDKRTNRRFNVKAILSMDPHMVHCGEVSVFCSTVIRLYDDGVWETLDWSGEYPSDSHNASTVMTNDFLVELSGKYVVENSEDVMGRLDGWRRYLDSREYLIDHDGRRGIDLGECVPETIIAFNTPGQPNLESHIALEHLDSRRDSAWTKDRINEDSRECVLVRLYVEYPEHEYLSEKNDRDNRKRRFDSFIRSPLILGPYPLQQEGKDRQLIHIRERSLGPSLHETIEPTDELEALDREEKNKIVQASENTEKEFEKEVESRMSAFKDSKLPSIVNKHIEAERGPLSKRIQIEMEQRLKNEAKSLSKRLEGKLHEKDNLSKTLTELDENSEKKRKKAPDISKAARLNLEIEKIQKEIAGLETKYDPAPEINRILGDMENKFTAKASSEARERFESELSPKYDRKKHDIIKTIKAEYSERKDEAIRMRSKARLFAYFELEVGDEQDLNQALKRYESLMKKEMGLFKDYTGEKKILERQRESLNRLLNGEVLNPFMATFLFNPGSAGNSIARHIGSFHIDNLNDSQRQAVEKALSSNGLFLIQGPPGTGKTQVIAEITAQIAISGRKVLIASQNNKAVDNAFSRMPKNPSIRMMRILSENAEKKQNKYSSSSLLANFYENLCDGLESEISKHEGRKGYLNRIGESIEELKEDISVLKDLRTRSESAVEKINQAESDLALERKKKFDIENQRLDAEEKIEKHESRASRIREFEDEQTLKTVKLRVEEIGFNLESLGDTRAVLKSIYDTDRSSIVSEFSEYAMHEEFFELKDRKSAAKDPNEISRLNRELREYREFNEFDEEESFPLLSTFRIIPDMDSLLEAKSTIDDAVNSRLSYIANAISILKKGIQSTSGVDAEIVRLTKRIDSLKHERAFKDRDDAEKRFQKKVKDLFTDLQLTESYSDETEVLDILERERRRMSEEFGELGREERLGAYRKIVSYLTSDDVIRIDSEAYNHVLLKTVNVIGMTCSAKSYFKDENDRSVNIDELNIDTVIVDEVSKVPFIEILQPILYGKTVILVGDHKQLPPIYSKRLNEGEESDYDSEIVSIEKEEEYKEMYENTFFADLFEKSPDSMKSRLTVQYRMHPDIMDVDNVFYGNQLEFGGNAIDKNHYMEVYGASGRKIISEDRHVVFIDVKGQEIQESGSTSFTNPREAHVVTRLLDMMDSSCRFDRNGRRLSHSYKGRSDDRLSLGVICPYADQARKIRGQKTRYNAFNNGPDEKIMVKSVDDFQGDERDIIILSMVRTKSSEFLKDYRRINVAISRARRLLVIVGNRTALEKMSVKLDGRMVPVYRNMIRTIEQKNGVLSEKDVMGDERDDRHQNHRESPGYDHRFQSLLQQGREAERHPIRPADHRRHRCVPQLHLGRRDGQDEGTGLHIQNAIPAKDRRDARIGNDRDRWRHNPRGRCFNSKAYETRTPGVRKGCGGGTPPGIQRVSRIPSSRHVEHLREGEWRRLCGRFQLRSGKVRRHGPRWNRRREPHHQEQEQIRRRRLRSRSLRYKTRARSRAQMPGEIHQPQAGCAFREARDNRYERGRELPEVQV